MSFHCGFDSTRERKEVMHRCKEALDRLVSALPGSKLPNQEWSDDGLTLIIWGDTQQALEQLHKAFEMFFSWRPAERVGEHWFVAYRI